MTETDNPAATPDPLHGVRIQDVADVAGVSVSTVSRVLNGRPDVAKSTRQRVMSTIDELAYSPNQGARRLASGRAHTVAIVYPMTSAGDSDPGFSPDIVRGAATTAESRGYVASLVTTSSTPAKLRAIYDSNHADGAIILEVSMEDWRINLLETMDRPFVALGRTGREDDLVYVDMDFAKGMYEAVAHLHQLGHNHIAMLGYDPKRHTQRWGPAVRTQQSFLHATARILGTPSPYLQVEAESTASANAVDLLLDTAPQTTAIITSETVAAPHVIQRLRHHGRQVPQDVAIVSTTSNAVAEIVTPTLTTINYNLFQAGVEACNLVLDLIEERPISRPQHLLEPNLTRRSST